MINLVGWAKTHTAQAAGAGGVGLVALLALYQRHKAATSKTSPNTVAATGTSPGTTGTSAVAGLSGLPNTQSTDIENWVNDQLNAFEQNQNAAAAGTPTPTPTPTPAASAVSWNVPYVTGDVYQDNAIANSSEVAGAFNAYKATGYSSLAAQQQYQQTYNAYRKANPVATS